MAATFEVTGRADQLFARLSREPDFDAPELRAYDAADLLLLETAAELASASAGSVGGGLTVIGDRHGPRRSEQRSALRAVCPDPVSGSAGSVGGGLTVIGDRHGALTLGAAELLGARDIRVHQDSLLGERALAANASRLGLAAAYASMPQLGEALLRGATMVLMQLPRSLAELDEIAWNIARWASPEVVVLAGGRDKHMSRSMNEELARCFGEVTAGRGSRKARVLTARMPRPPAALDPPRYPVWGSDPELPFELAAFGATFGGAALDHGSRLLLGTLREHPPTAPPRTVLDIGCGNGTLAVSAALAWPQARILATDQSAAAVSATRLTAEAAGVADRVEVRRADASEAAPEGWADLVLLNPPFHTGSTVHAGVAHRLIRSVPRVLAQGGELRLVFNSHLDYRPLVQQCIGATRQLARNRTFTVLAAQRPE